MNLSQAQPASKQISLGKLIDADGTQIQWLSDADRFALLGRLQYTSIITGKQTILQQWKGRSKFEELKWAKMG